MKPFAIFALCATLLTSCGEKQPKSNPSGVDAAPEASPSFKSAETGPVAPNNQAVDASYPEALARVLAAHGGLEAWKSQRTLAYTIPKETLPERHTIDLYSRKDRIETEAFSMGFDGEKTWILDPDKVYQGNPEFYHNLMFYFYAMPFVLADPGIRYSATPDLEFLGRAYPGIRIGYGDGVGVSPEDEYYLHFDPETGHMAWLGYTVTYRTGEPSDNIKWIRYDDWQPVDGLLLPRSISWYDYQGREPGDRRNTVQFSEVTLGESARPEGYYNKPEGAVYFVPE